MVTEAWRRERCQGALASLKALKSPGPCESILVSEWLAHKLIRGYLEGFTEQTWPAVVKWTFILGVLSLKNSGIPFHSLSVDDLVDIVNQNGYSSLTPAQRLVPLQWAASTPSRTEPRDPAVSSPEFRCLDTSAGVSADTRSFVGVSSAGSGGACRKRVTFSHKLSGLRRHSASPIARKPSSDWRAGNPAIFAPSRPSQISSQRETSSCFSSAPETYPSWWGDSALPPHASWTYTAAALGPRQSPRSRLSPNETPLTPCRSAVHTPHNHRPCVCGAHEKGLFFSRSEIESDQGTATPKFGYFADLRTKEETDVPCCSTSLSVPHAPPPRSHLCWDKKPFSLPSSSKSPRHVARPTTPRSSLVADSKPPADSRLPPSSSARPSRPSLPSPSRLCDKTSLASPSPGRRANSARVPVQCRRRPHATCLKQRNLHKSRHSPNPLPPIDGFQAFRPAQEARWVCTLRPSSHRHLPPPSPRSSVTREALGSPRLLHAQTLQCHPGRGGEHEVLDREETGTEVSPSWGVEETSPSLLRTGWTRSGRRTRETKGPKESEEETEIVHAVEAARAAATPFRRVSQDEAFHHDGLQGSPQLGCSSYAEAALAAYTETPSVETPDSGRKAARAPRERVACCWEISVDGRPKPADRCASLTLPGRSQMRFGQGSSRSTNPVSATEPLGSRGCLLAEHASPHALSEGDELNSSPRSAARDSCTDSETLSSLSLDRVAFSPSRVPTRILETANVASTPLPHHGEFPLLSSTDVFDGRRETLSGAEGERRRLEESLPLGESVLSSACSLRDAGVSGDPSRSETKKSSTSRDSDFWREKESEAIRDLLEMYWGEAEKIENGDRKGDSEADVTQEATCFDSTEVASPDIGKVSPVNSSPE